MSHPPHAEPDDAAARDGDEAYAPSPVRWAAVVIACLALAILSLVLVFPGIASGVREQLYRESLATAQSLAATARAPSATPFGAQPSATPLAPGARLDSGGLGLDHATWDTIYGAVEHRSGTFLVYGDGRFVIELARERVRLVERAWDGAARPSPDSARLAVEALLPADYRLAAVEPHADATLHLSYRSASLAAVLQAEGWAGALDTVIVVLELADGAVSRATTSLAATPP
ncbi:MAG: hypothetical protein KGS47_01520 [Chloroflexi bacterium]|nr:hypothetical protein [Chloroflexota bacterium]